MSIISLDSNDSNTLNSWDNPIGNTATSHPRTRRMVLYENDNEESYEIGLWFDVKLIFSRFRHCASHGRELCGYSTDIHHVIGAAIRESWPEFELLHAKMFVLVHYFDANQSNDTEIQAEMTSFINDVNDFIDELREDTSIVVLALYRRISTLIGNELRILKKLTLSTFRPNSNNWKKFVRAFHEINFWGVSFDISSVFENHLNRKFPNCNFHRRIADRLNSVMDIWVDDNQLLEFHSIVEPVQTSTDMSGGTVPLPMDAECLCYNISGTMVGSRIGLIQSDGIEIRLGIRFLHKNMISATNFNPTVMGDFVLLARESKSYFQSHYNRVNASYLL